VYSAGGQRQYSGALAETGNCQLAVSWQYAERTLAWPVAVRLYLPKRWAEGRDLRRAARVPDDVSFRTKPQLTLALLDEARARRAAGADRPAGAPAGEQGDAAVGGGPARRRS
jgi:SRSO17 transposase